MTYKAIGEVFGISQERVRQIEKRTRELNTLAIDACIRRAWRTHRNLWN